MFPARRSLLVLALSILALPAADAQQYDPSLFDAMRWRMIGPYRGGRTKAAAGIPSQPNVFFIGATNGGVWKTTDYGRTWVPIFDDQPTGSIGAIAIAPSNPDIIYVGSGEGLQRPDLSTGDGIYKSIDGGKTWRHLGLRDGQQIPQIVVHPSDPNKLFVAVLGHPYGPIEERGIFRSNDGGESFHKVLYKDENTGGIDIVLDPTDVNTVFAVLWESRQAPWENGVFTGPGSGVFKSTDGGETWRQITQGLPTFAEGLGRIGLTIAPSDARRMYATVEAPRVGGLYRSDDAGESWARVTTDSRVASRASDFAEVKVDPTNPDIVYTGSIVAWKSVDGGRTWTAFRGAPGGDDYHRIWINPNDPKIILLASDQGAIVTVNGGETFSSWYNQPTAQFYHVSTDNAFPYRVCGGQQESGSACVASRSDDGQITFRDWRPVGVEEYGYVAPDPLDPNIVYGGKVTRFDRRTGQVQNVAPKALRASDYRVLRTAPVLFSPVDPRALYFASNVVWRTRDGGRSWTQISPDLTRRDSVVPPSIAAYASSPAARARHPGVVYTIAPSYRSASVIWAGSDDGLIHVTLDGGRSWKNVTPPDLVPWAKVSLIDAGRFDSLTAYAAINAFRLDDLRPHIYRTHDGGKTWTHIANGIPDGGSVNVVREDAVRRGLLYAGTEREVYVSFDDGDHWQSLRLDMPAISIRDLVVKDDDIAVGTHGRGFWILDDVTPLRQLDARIAAADAHLFAPQTAIRFRWSKYTDTPMPQEEPAGQNPPDGAILDYHLKSAATGPVTLEILDRAGAVVRRYSSSDEPEQPIEGRNTPDYWLRPPQVLSAAAGMHRFVWDLHYPRPAVQSFGYPISAIYRNTVQVPQGSWALPGRYSVRLTVNGRSYTQPLTVRMDPRVKTPAAGIQQQFTLSRVLDTALRMVRDAQTGAAKAREQIVSLKQNRVAAPLLPAIDSLDEKLSALAGGGGESLARLSGELATLYGIVEGVDAAPTTQTVAAIADRRRAVEGAMRRWGSLMERDVVALNTRLRAAGLAPIE